MISVNEYQIFDPTKMRASKLPDKPGNYLVVLRKSSLLPQCSQIDFTPKLTSLEYLGEDYEVIYTGSSKKSLRFRIYRQHLLGNSGISVLRKSLGSLMGLQLASSTPSTKSRFSDEDEKYLTNWMMNNLFFLYYVNDNFNSVEKELIITYHPPLNLKNNRDNLNVDFRKSLLNLHSQEKLVVDKCNMFNTFCPNCYANVMISNELKDEEYIKCMSCRYIFKNPFCEHVKSNAEKKKWKWSIIFVMVVFIFFLLMKMNEHFNENNKGVYGSTIKNETSQRNSASDIVDSLIIKLNSNDVSKSSSNNESQIDLIGKWRDNASFYELYKKDGKIFLNYSDIITISCNLHTLKKDEYRFRNDKNGLFSYSKGVQVYIGTGFEECYDTNNNRYMSTVMLLIQNGQLYVYSNDYDRNVYDELCVASR